MVTQSSIKSILGTRVTGVGTDLSGTVQALSASAKFSRVTRMSVTHNHGQAYEPSAAVETPEEAVLGPFDPRFDVEGPAWSDGSLDHILLSVFGDVTDSGAGDPWTHTFKPSSSVATGKNYLSIERPLGPQGGLNIEALNVAISRFELRGGDDSQAKFSAQGLGGNYVLRAGTAATLRGTGSSPACDPIPGRHNTVLTLGAQTSFKLDRWRWFVDHHLFENDYDGNSRIRKGAHPQEFEAGFEVEVLLERTDELSEFLAATTSDTAPSTTQSTGTKYAANIKTTARASPEHSIALDIPKCFLEAAPVEMDGRGVLRQKIRGRALFDSTAGAATCILKNGIATAA